MQRTQDLLSTSSVSSSLRLNARVGHIEMTVSIVYLPPDPLDVGLHLFLVDLHVVAPGADHGEVGAMDRVDAIVAAAGELELELVGQRRTMHLVEERVDASSDAP